MAVNGSVGGRDGSTIRNAQKWYSLVPTGKHRCPHEHEICQCEPGIVSHSWEWTAQIILEM